MIETPAPLNSYNVAQLQFALHDGRPAFAQSPFDKTPIDAISFDVLHDSPALAPVHAPHEAIHYLSRRMSSSATSDSSLLSKRPASPARSPEPRAHRPTLQPTHWSQPATPSPQPSADTDDRDDRDARVHLPSLASIQDHHDARRASLPTLFPESRLPNPAHRPSQSSSGLSAYQFPPPDQDRPRLTADTHGYPASEYAGSALPSATHSSTASSFSFPLSPENSRGSIAGLSTFSSDSNDTWGTGIARPSSTPGQPPQKYDDSLRHGSLASPQQQQLFGGVTRISGQHKASPPASAGVKTEAEWTFPSADNFSLPASSASYPPTPSSSMPAISVASSPSRSPQALAPAQAPLPPPGSLVERPRGKRGKLPKPVTDFLKDWLHRHSDHPYPSEEEKKQLCNATGLSMSQVSNWMINARRRILAPLHRPGAGPTTTTPFNTRASIAGASLPPAAMLDSGRRASMPSDSLQLYYPMSLQPLHDPAQTRHMVGLARAHSHAAPLGTHGHGASPYALEYGRGYGSALHPHAQLGHGSGARGYGMGVPLGAAGGLGGSFLGAQPHSQTTMYSQSTPGAYAAAREERYGFGDAHGHGHGHAHGASVSPTPQPGSGYATPQ